MKSINDIKELLEMAQVQQDNLLRIAHDEEKECGQVKENTIKNFNALMFAISNAYETIDKGLNGEF